MKLLASLIFFTRLPFWKIANVPPVYFKRVVDYWPFVGWLTGGIMAGTLWITAEFLPVQIAVLMALAARLLATGVIGKIIMLVEQKEDFDFQYDNKLQIKSNL